MSDQPLFGDRAMNHKGHDGYGYEEHEQYVNRKDNDDNPEKEYRASLSHKNVIAIQAGWDQGKVDREALACRMEKLGEAFFDDGEAMTDDHMVEQTVHYYANHIPNQTAAFLDRVRDVVPDATITLQDEYSDDLGDDVSRFLPDVNMAELDFDGLEDGLEQ